MARYEIGEASRLSGLGEELLDGLLGHAGAATKLGGALTGLAVECCEGCRLRVERRHFLCAVDRGHQVLVLLVVADRDRTIISVQEQSHSGWAALHRTDGGYRAHSIEDFGGHVLEVFALRDHEDLFVFGPEGGLDGTQGPGAAGRDRRSNLGEKNRFAKRNHWQSRQVSHLFLQWWMTSSR